MSTERDSDWEVAFNSGLIYELSESVQLNLGLSIGVTHSADDLTAFAGMAWRF